MVKDFLKILFLEDLPSIHAYYSPRFFSLARELKNLGLEVIYSDYRRLAWFNNNGVSFSKTYINYKDNRINLNTVSMLTPLLYNETLSSLTYKLEERNLEKYILKNKIDMIFTHKYFKSIKQIKKYGIKLILFSGDEDFSKEWFNLAKESDIVFCVTEFGVKVHQEKGIKCKLLRNATDDKFFRPRSKCKILDFVFIGRNLPDRRNRFQEMIMPLIKKYRAKVHLFGYDWEDLRNICSVHEPIFWYQQPLIYSHAKISLHINRESWPGVSTRVFDVMACKTFLLSNYTEEIAKLFENKRDIVIAKNGKEMLELAQYYLDNEIEREKIATNGYEKVINNHTFKQRAKQVYDVIRFL
jgi:spore maturation protein CgeB